MKFNKFIPLFLTALFLGIVSCAGNKSSESTEKAAVDDEAFYATQPVKSGLYDASFYEITGAGEKKGHFDGRIYFSLSPELSAMYVFENGNRTKIDYTVSLQKPFEKTDSGTFASLDAKGNLVTVTPDSIWYLDFSKGESNIKIGFDPKPRHTGTALEILEKINETKQKNNK